MSLVNGGIEGIVAADLRGPPPDAGGRVLIKSPARWAQGADPLTQWPIPKICAAHIFEKLIFATPKPDPTATETPFVKPAEGLYGEPIHGGNSFNDAVPIKTGVLYHLDYHQPTDREDFFKVDVKGGQRLQITGLSGTTYCIGFSLNDSRHQSLGGAGQWQGRQKAVFARDFADGQDGTYFFWSVTAETRLESVSMRLFNLTSSTSPTRAAAVTPAAPTIARWRSSPAFIRATI
jgi:hypothetical protein